MTNAATLSAVMLAGPAMSDDQFFGATALLSTRFDRCGERGDLRSDIEAPRLLFDWFKHARLRVPDLRVWDLNCQVHEYFDPEAGLYLPQHWQWDARDRLLESSELLSRRPEWQPVFERALMTPSAESIRALVCCAARRLGVDPYPMLWRYLSEHVDTGYNWHLIAGSIDRHRLPDYLALARMTLLRNERDREHSHLPSPRSIHLEELWDVWRQVLRLLHEFPGEGVDLVERALWSGDAGLRILAIELLAIHWQGRHIPLDTLNLIRERAACETDDAARRGFDLLLQRV